MLDIGVQDSAGEQARLAFDARLPNTPRSDAYGPDQSLALVWSLRGAPYVHRRGELDELAGALYPLSEADAAQRLNETGPSVARAGISALDQFTTAVEAMRDVVRKPMGKGAVSTAVTKAIPKADAPRLPGLQDEPHLRLGDAVVVPRGRSGAAARHGTAGDAAAQGRAGRRPSRT